MLLPLTWTVHVCAVRTCPCADLDGLMHIQDWAKPYVFEKLHADDSNSGLTIIGRKGYWGRNMLCEKLDVDVDGNGTEVAGYGCLSSIYRPMSCVISVTK